jgi:hypothetical protein
VNLSQFNNLVWHVIVFRTWCFHGNHILTGMSFYIWNKISLPCSYFHIFKPFSIVLLILITYESFLVVFWCFGNLKKSKMAVLWITRCSYNVIWHDHPMLLGMFIFGWYYTRILSKFHYHYLYIFLTRRGEVQAQCF